MAGAAAKAEPARARRPRSAPAARGAAGAGRGAAAAAARPPGGRGRGRVAGARPGPRRASRPGRRRAARARASAAGLGGGGRGVRGGGRGGRGAGAGGRPPGQAQPERRGMPRRGGGRAAWSPCAAQAPGRSAVPSQLRVSPLSNARVSAQPASAPPPPSQLLLPLPPRCSTSTDSILRQPRTAPARAPSPSARPLSLPRARPPLPHAEAGRCWESCPGAVRVSAEGAASVLCSSATQRPRVFSQSGLPPLQVCLGKIVLKLVLLSARPLYDLALSVLSGRWGLSIQRGPQGFRSSTWTVRSALHSHVSWEGHAVLEPLSFPDAGQ